MISSLLSSLVRSGPLVSDAGLVTDGAVSEVNRSRMVEEILEPVSSEALMMLSQSLVPWV